jgi:hypothetical protein
MIRCALLLTLAVTACSDGSESTRPQHQMVAAVRQGLYAIKAAPGGAIARFSDVRLIGRNTVCGTVDAQDGGGLRRFASVAGSEPVIEGSGDAQALAKIKTACRGPARKVTSRNPGYSDVTVEEQAH